MTSEPQPVEIRRASPSDADAIASVAEASWQADYPDILNRENVEAVHEWYDPERMAESIGSVREILFVARPTDDPDAVLGFVHAFDDSGRADVGQRTDSDQERERAAADVGHILRVYVHPDHRGRGIGADLVAAARDELYDRGCTRVRATVLAANEPGQAFYVALGFDREGGSGRTEIGDEFYEEVSFVDSRR